MAISSRISVGKLAAQQPERARASEDWSAAPLGRLIDHVVQTHHKRLRSELLRLEQLLTKVALYHGLRYCKLIDVAETFLAMKSELLNHMLKEEQVLFPMIRRLEAGVPAPLSVRNPIAVMENEHRRAGEAMEQMRRLTNDYTAPPDGCSAFQTLVAGLAELEEDLHQHIHKESHILFPRAEERERSLEVHPENDHASCLAPSRQPADAP